MSRLRRDVQVQRLVRRTLIEDFEMSKEDANTNQQKLLDEKALQRCCEMAHESLNPQEVAAFTYAHNMLIDRRRLKNEAIR